MAGTALDANVLYVHPNFNLVCVLFSVHFHFLLIFFITVCLCNPYSSYMARHLLLKVYFPLSFRVRFTAIDSDQHILRPVKGCTSASF